MSNDADDLLIRIIEMAIRIRPDENGRVRLPTERELAELLNVQRPTVRDRLTVLETLGFIKRRQGSGTYLSLPNSKVMQFYFEVSLKLGFLSMDQIQKALEMIGMEMAMSAAIDGSREELGLLDQVLVKMASAQSIEVFAQTQLDFHLVLAKASHNPVISLMIEGLTSVIRTVVTNRVRMISVVKGSFERSVRSYQMVVHALKEHEPESARIALQECFALWRRESSKISMLYVSD